MIEVASFFYRFVFEGKGPLAFWEGALSLSKSLSISKTNLKIMTPPLSPLTKSARSQRISVTSCDIVVAWVLSQVHKKKPWQPPEVIIFNKEATKQAWVMKVAAASDAAAVSKVAWGQPPS